LVSTIQLSVRKERTIPYISQSYLIWGRLISISYLYAGYVIGMMTGVLVSMIFVLLINLKWKISAHLCAIGGLCAAILVVSHRLGLNASLFFAIAFIIAGLLSTVRMILQAHTLMQTIAGFFVGFICVFFFGLLI
jgi:hypothetical protein